jgi:hypothetical protein
MRASSILVLAATLASATGAEVTVLNGGKLIVKSQLTTTGEGIRVESGGKLQLNGTINGAVEVASGGLLDVGDDQIVSAQLNGGLSLAGTLRMQIGNSTGLPVQDHLSGLTSIAMGGTLELSHTGDALTVSQSFDLWDAALTTGDVPQVTGDALPDGLFYHTWGLETEGTIQVSCTPETYAQWAAYYGAGAETTDLNDDGTCNLLEFALGISPVTGGNTLPYHQVEQDLTGNRLALTVHLPVPAPPAAVYTVEASDTLGTDEWQTLAQRTGNGDWAGAAAVTTSPAAGGLQTHRIQDVVAGSTKRFIRLRVE